MPLSARAARTSLLLTLALALAGLASPPALASSAAAPGSASVAAVDSALTWVPPCVPPDGQLYCANTFNLQSLSWNQLWENGAPLSQFAADGRKDPSGVPWKLWRDGKYHYSPVQIALQGLARLDSYVRTSDARYLPTLQLLDAKLKSMPTVVGNAWFMPFSFNYGNEKLTAPWYNAMANGFALSFFTRMHRVFGDATPDQTYTDSEAANHVFAAFSVMGPIAGPWVAMVESGYLWLEHYPKGIHQHVLNAHMHTLFGLYDYWQEVGTPDARHVLEGAITTMRYNVNRYRRVGRTSLYCLVKPTSWLHYHRLHIKQLGQLALLSGDPYFTSEAARFRSDAW